MRLLNQPAKYALVKVVAAQRRVTVGGQHLEHALGQFQDGNIKRAAAQVIHGIHTFRGVIQAVGNRCRSRFVQQTQHIQSGQFGGIFGGLALRIVKIRWHGNHRADQVAA